jgi:hypothetical protein
MISEREWQKQVVHLASLAGWKVHHNWTEIHSPKGWPDLTFCKPPRLVFAELKSEKGKTTPEQDEWLNQLRECGQEAYVWRPSDLQTVGNILGLEILS